MIFHYRTDAGAHDIRADSLAHAVDQIVSIGDWYPLDTVRERTDIERGAYLVIHSNGVLALLRGKMP